MFFSASLVRTFRKDCQQLPYQSVDVSEGGDGVLWRVGELTSQAGKVPGTGRYSENLPLFINPDLALSHLQLSLAQHEGDGSERNPASRDMNDFYLNKVEL